MRMKAAECTECNDIIYLRATQDFRECSCGYTNISGGFEHMRANNVLNEECKLIEINIDVTREELYYDWNKMTDEYGLIKGGDSEIARSVNI